MLLKKNIPFTYILGKIKRELFIITLYTIAIAILYENYHITRITIPIAIPAIMGTVISLLLGFRSNQAYDRWWEARHIWGSIVNDSRTFARQILCFTEVMYEGDDVHQWRQRMIRRQTAWCYCLGQALRGQNPVRGIDRLLTRQDMDFIRHYDHVPGALLELHARDLRLALENGWINRFQQVELDRTISRLCDAMGKCERIKNTVFPVTYSMYIHFSMLLFIALLPFAVIQYFGMLEVPVVVAIATSFLLIEKMAIHLQEPFENKPTDTPMTSIARTIEKNLSQMLRDQQINEEKETTTGFYVL